MKVTKEIKGILNNYWLERLEEKGLKEIREEDAENYITEYPYFRENSGKYELIEERSITDNPESSWDYEEVVVETMSAEEALAYIGESDVATCHGRVTIGNRRYVLMSDDDYPFTMVEL